MPPRCTGSQVVGRGRPQSGAPGPSAWATAHHGATSHASGPARGAPAVCHCTAPGPHRHVMLGDTWHGAPKDYKIYPRAEVVSWEALRAAQSTQKRTIQKESREGILEALGPHAFRNSTSDGVHSGVNMVGQQLKSVDWGELDSLNLQNRCSGCPSCSRAVRRARS